MADDDTVNAWVSTRVDLALEDRELVAGDSAASRVCEALTVVKDVGVLVRSDGRASQDVLERLRGSRGDLGSGENITYIKSG